MAGALSMSTSGNHGADEFFPVLIYVLLQAIAITTPSYNYHVAIT